MPKKILFLIMLCTSVFAYNAVNVSAQADTLTGPGLDKPFVTCGGKDAQGNDQPPCTVADLIGADGLVQRGLNIVFMLVGFFAAALFMYAGFLMITAGGNPAQINKAKGIFKNVTVGVIIILAAVLIIKQLLNAIGAVDFFKNIII
jgi:hypothetical protein